MKNLFFNLLYNWNGLNKKIFLLLNSFFNKFALVKILKYLSYMFNIYVFAIIYICAVFIFLYKLNKVKDKYSFFFEKYPKFIEIGIAYAFFGIVFAILKFSVNLPRPFCSLGVSDFKTIIDVSTERCLSSFPSAHTGLAFFMLYFLWNRSNYIYRSIYILILLLVAISRITLAMHYPADILYSIIITFVVIKIAYLFNKKLKTLISFLGNKFFFFFYKNG